MTKMVVVNLDKITPMNNKDVWSKGNEVKEVVINEK
jgi:hypothetical protein